MAPRAHVGRVSEDGKTLFLRSLPAWRAAIARQKGREVEVSIRRKAEPVTQDQHGYYRSTILPLLADEWGWGNPKELHHELKVLHLPGIIPVDEWPERRVGAEVRREVPSCADLTCEQMSAFIDAVINQARDCGITVPPPRGKE